MPQTEAGAHVRLGRRGALILRAMDEGGREEDKGGKGRRRDDDDDGGGLAGGGATSLAGHPRLPAVQVAQLLLLPGRLRREDVVQAPLEVVG